MSRVILHVDMNNFYASVECMLNPELRGKPVAVCGDEDHRHGIVLAKNYPAKACGVSTGEAIWQAKQKCPDLVVVHPHFDEYMRFSRDAREIYARYTEIIEPYGMDECWLDCTSGISLFGSGMQIAEEIRQTVKLELGVTVSIGVSFNKIFAKLGSDMKKPDAITEIPEESFKDIIYGLPASDMLGVGRATGKKLRSYGINTIGDIAEWPPDFFKRRFGKCGLDLWKFANGFDNSPVIPMGDGTPDKTVGHGMTTDYDLTENEEVKILLIELAQDIGHRLHVYEKKATGVALYVRDNKLMTRQWQCMLPVATQGAGEIAKTAYKLFLANYSWDLPIRTVTVRAIGLEHVNVAEAPDIFFDAEKNIKEETLDNAVEDIRSRFGKGIVKNAVVVGHEFIPNDHFTANMPTGMPRGA